MILTLYSKCRLEYLLLTRAWADNQGGGGTISHLGWGRVNPEKIWLHQSFGNGAAKKSESNVWFRNLNQQELKTHGIYQQQRPYRKKPLISSKNQKVWNLQERLEMRHKITESWLMRPRWTRTEEETEGAAYDPYHFPVRPGALW